MGNVRERAVEKIGILIIENDEGTQSALRQVLDSEGWQLRIVPHVSQALAELSSGAWSLVIVNISMTGLAGPVFLTLKELALASKRTRRMGVASESVSISRSLTFSNKS